MSIIFDRTQRIAAVVACGALLVFATWTDHGWAGFAIPETPPQEVHDVKAGVAILERARAPIRGMQPCDTIKSLLPEKFDTATGDHNIKVNAADVIVCFRSDIDFGEAIKQAGLRGLGWQGELGGDKILVFAPSRERFVQVAAQNGLILRPGELRASSLLLKQMRSEGRARLEDGAWIIAPSINGAEVAYGPYTSLGPGRYRLNMIFAPAGPGGCASAARQEKLEVSLTARSRADILAPRQVVALQPSPGAGSCELVGSLLFTVPAAAENVETPFWLTGLLPMRMTGLTIEPVR